MNQQKSFSLITAMMLAASVTHAQSVAWISSTDGTFYQEGKMKLQTKAAQTPLLTVEGTEQGTTFENWGTTFNELGWDALGVLTRQEQDDILQKLFAPQGELRFTRGRISMEAND